MSIPVLLQGKLRHGEISSLSKFSGLGFQPRRSYAQVHEQHQLHLLGCPNIQARLASRFLCETSCCLHLYNQ